MNIQNRCVHNYVSCQYKGYRIPRAMQGVHKQLFALLKLCVCVLVCIYMYIYLCVCIYIDIYIYA